MPDENPYAAGKSGELRCRNCNTVLKANAVLCVDCGFDLRSGRVRGTTVDQAITVSIGAGVRLLSILTLGIIGLQALVVWVLFEGSSEAIVFVGPSILMMGVGFGFVIFTFAFRKKYSFATRDKRQILQEEWQVFEIRMRSFEYELGNFTEAWFVQSAQSAINYAAIATAFIVLCTFSFPLFIVWFWYFYSPANSVSVKYGVELRNDKSKQRQVVLRGGEHIKAEATQLAKMCQRKGKLAYKQELGLA